MDRSFLGAHKSSSEEKQIYWLISKMYYGGDGSLSSNKIGKSGSSFYAHRQDRLLDTKYWTMHAHLFYTYSVQLC